MLLFSIVLYELLQSYSLHLGYKLGLCAHMEEIARDESESKVYASIL